jgi:predicted DNA-binding protein
MNNSELQDTKLVSVRLPTDLIKYIDDLSQGSERNFSQQLRLMLKKYIEILETSK